MNALDLFMAGVTISVIYHFVVKPMIIPALAKHNVKKAFIGPWEGTEQCSACMQSLTFAETHRNSGVCPYCGVSGNRSYVHTHKVVFRWRRDKDNGKRYRQIKGTHPK